MLLSKTPTLFKRSRQYSPPLIAAKNFLNFLQANHYSPTFQEDHQVWDYLKQENLYAKQSLSCYDNLKNILRREMQARYEARFASIPYIKAGRYYWSECRQGESRLKIWTKKQGCAARRLLLDTESLAANCPHFVLGNYEVSSSETLVYTYDPTGGGSYYLAMKGKYGKELLLRVEKEFVLSPDGKSVFYVQQNEEGRGFCLQRHYHYPCMQKDEVLFEEQDERLSLQIESSSNGRWLFLYSVSSDACQVRAFDLFADQIKPILLQDTTPGRCYAQSSGEIFYLFAPFKQQVLKIVRGQASQVVIEAGFDAPLQEMRVSGGYMILVKGKAGAFVLEVWNIEKNQRVRSFSFKEPFYHLALHPDIEEGSFCFTYSSPKTPDMLYAYHFANNQLRCVAQESGKSFLLQDLVLQRTQYTAEDGSVLPLDLVYQKEVRLDGKSPLVMACLDFKEKCGGLGFDRDLLTLLRRGYIIALPHIRKGPPGRDFDEASEMERKRSVDDFMDAALHLIKQRYTSPEKLLAWGRRAGGLIVASAVHCQPMWFKAAVLENPSLSCVTLAKPCTAAGVTGGARGEREGQMPAYLRHLPYQKYPPIFILDAVYAPSFISSLVYAAHLRRCKTDHNPLYLQMEARAREGKSELEERWEKKALVYLFLLQNS